MRRIDSLVICRDLKAGIRFSPGIENGALIQTDVYFKEHGDPADLGAKVICLKCFFFWSTCVFVGFVCALWVWGGMGEGGRGGGICRAGR